MERQGLIMVEKKQIDWSSLGFGYMETDYRFVANYKNGAWEEGTLTKDANVVINECAGVLQYSQSCFEGLKAYTTEDGHIVTFRPDLNAQRMKDSCERLEMPVYPVDQWVEAVKKTVKANEAWVAPYGSGATLYIRPYMFGSNPVIGVKPADEYQFRILTTPVGPYFKGGVKPITIRISDFDRAAPHGTGHIKAGLNYAMSLHAIMDAHRNGFDENQRRYPGCAEELQHPAVDHPQKPGLHCEGDSGHEGGRARGAVRRGENGRVLRVRTVRHRGRHFPGRKDL